MDTNEFMKEVAKGGQFSSTTEAREATRATLATVAEVLPQDRAEQLATVLPMEMAEWVSSTKDEPAEGHQLDHREFTERVGQRLRGGVEAQHAEQLAHHVLGQLRVSVSDDVWSSVAACVPEGLGEPRAS